ncbi:UNVERIFIED_CONTAM: hypothetical protein Sradi_5105400 [Sesamum radiatum]|uniref:RNase H type-1 domain-containing protein n=1 Tax=Sesamum radiatum TaxID=300843 RepID=A0AAW2M5W4_SESRA
MRSPTPWIYPLGLWAFRYNIEISFKVSDWRKANSQPNWLLVTHSNKSYLMKPPVLVAPVLGHPLILYVAAQERSVGILLTQKNDEGKKNALYDLSMMMTPNELKYSPIEKLCLALIFSIQKLKHYFYLIAFIWSQRLILLNFVDDHPMSAEWELSHDLPDEDVLVIEVTPPWKMYFDGASNKEGAGAGVVFVTSEGEVLPYSFTLTQNCSNNIVGYQALILGLKIVVDAKQLTLNIYGDSQVVVNQLLGIYEVKKPELLLYHNYARRLMGWLGDVELEDLPRKDKKQANALAKLASTLSTPTKKHAYQYIRVGSYHQSSVTMRTTRSKKKITSRRFLKLKKKIGDNYWLTT